MSIEKGQFWQLKTRYVDDLYYKVMGYPIMRDAAESPMILLWSVYTGATFNVTPKILVREMDLVEDEETLAMLTLSLL